MTYFQYHQQVTTRFQIKPLIKSLFQFPTLKLLQNSRGRESKQGFDLKSGNDLVSTNNRFSSQGMDGGTIIQNTSYFYRPLLKYDFCEQDRRFYTTLFMDVPCPLMILELSTARQFTPQRHKNAHVYLCGGWK